MKKASDLIQGYFNPDQSDSYDLLVKIKESWGEMAGKDVAAHSRVFDFKNGELIIKVDHSAIIQIIQLKKKGIIDYLKNTLKIDELDDVRCILNDVVDENNYSPKEKKEKIVKKDMRTEKFKRFRDRINKNVRNKS